VCAALLIHGASVTKISQPRTIVPDASEKRKYRLSGILETLDGRTDAGLTKQKKPITKSNGPPLSCGDSLQLHALRYEMLSMDFSCELGAGLMTTGDHGTALTLIVNALDVQQQAGKFLHMPNLLRMKGLVLASRSIEDHAEAEQSLLSSIGWAKRQSATLIELKAAKDLAELKQGRMPEAYKHLSAALD